MSEWVKFQTNVPETVALKFATGKQVKSKIAGAHDQMFYSLADGRGMYVPLTVGVSISAMGIQANEPFRIFKREVANGKVRSISWEVEKLEGPVSSGEAVTEPPVQSSKDQPQSITQNGKQTNGHSAIPFGASGYGQYALSALVNTIDLCVAAEQYAAAKGRDIKFSAEDVRAFAISFFIAHSREVR